MLFRSELGWQRAHIVGHSLGGLVAQKLALTARERVRTLSLLCTFSRGADATKMTPKTVARIVQSTPRP